MLSDAAEHEATRERTNGRNIKRIKVEPPSILYVACCIAKITKPSWKSTDFDQQSDFQNTHTHIQTHTYTGVPAVSRVMIRMSSITSNTSDCMNKVPLGLKCLSMHVISSGCRKMRREAGRGRVAEERDQCARTTVPPSLHGTMYHVVFLR